MPTSLRLYLQNVLSSNGARAAGGRELPYTELSKHAIEDHLVNLQEIFPSLGVTVDEFCTNNGRMLHLLKADGTIPVHFQGNRYNIPITIWLPEEYPVEAPIVFVVPTHSMIIKPGHPQVNSSGQVNTPSLCTWHPCNNLVELTFELSECFGKDPPLYAKPPGPPPGAPPPSPPDSFNSQRSRPPPPPPPPPPAPSTQPYSPPPIIPTSSASTPPPVRPPPHYPSGGPSLPWGQFGGFPPPPPPPPPAPATSYPMASNPLFPPISQPPPPPPLDPTLSSHPIWGPAFAASASGSSLNQQQQQPQPPPPPPPPPPTSASMSSSSYSSSFSRPPPPPPPQPPPTAAPQHPPPPPPPLATRAEANAKFHELAVAGLQRQLEAAELKFLEQASLETNELLETQRNLADRKRQLDAIVRGLKQEREGTEGLVKEMGTKSEQLQQWLERNKPKAEALEASGGIDWDTVIVPADDVAKQALSAQAEDHAIEDTIVAMDKALQVGLQGLTLDVYLKQVRGLCRKQFFARALAIKASEVQQQSKPPPPPPPPLVAGMPGMGIPNPSRPAPPPPGLVPTQVIGTSRPMPPAPGKGTVPLHIPPPPPPPGHRPHMPVPPFATSMGYPAPPIPPPIPIPPASNAMPAVSNPLTQAALMGSPLPTPVVPRPIQSRPMQPYPKVQR